ncbi:TylF/MycF/NovP-related O-methyltransferase [Paenibacillus sp. GCM10027626]|uniref:TylF/MycF/NovP-related O-methyltransferase n=1 Tax=Paenibacillus sp. GCM10027626 TaxID=3273411 RepID=UPI0036372147
MGNKELIDSLYNSRLIEDRMDHIKFSLEQVSIYSGLYLEFGVRKGYSANFIADIINPSLIYGFDSFAGLPEKWKRSVDDEIVYPAGTFAVESLPEVRDNVRLVKGWFQDTLPTFKFDHPENIAFINIDSDLYSSAKTILNELNGQIVPGTILYFDEITGWGELIRQYENWREGEYKALIEWIDQYNRKVSPVSRNGRYGATLKVII